MGECHAVEMGWNLGDWVWCLHCQRCYQVGEFREIRGLQMCPYDDCGGDTVVDAWSWLPREYSEGVRRPDWPEVPERGVFYE
jgi:hypothetical protein